LLDYDAKGVSATWRSARKSLAQKKKQYQKK
jgi:hypothetical protein